MQSGETDLALGTVVNEQGYNVFVALLEGHCEGREAILEEETKYREVGVKNKERGSQRICYLFYFIEHTNSWKLT